jgi:hypothetical protein
MRHLAEALAIRAPSLYKHFRDKVSVPCCCVLDRGRPLKAIESMLKDLAEKIRRSHVRVMPRSIGPGDDGGVCYFG